MSPVAPKGCPYDPRPRASRPWAPPVRGAGPGPGRGTMSLFVIAALLSQERIPAGREAVEAQSAQYW